MNTEDKKRCTECGAFFASSSNSVKYCPECRKRITRRQAAERMKKCAPCYAIGAQKPLCSAVLTAVFPSGKDLISFPSKMAFYCVTPFPCTHRKPGRGGHTIGCRAPVFIFLVLKRLFQRKLMRRVVYYLRFRHCENPINALYILCYPQRQM